MEVEIKIENLEELVKIVNSMKGDFIFRFEWEDTNDKDEQ